MSTKRIKATTAAIETRAQFDALVDEICKLQLDRELAITARDEELQVILEKRNPEINDLGETIAAKVVLCEKYATVHRDSLYTNGLKSTDSSLGTHGFRTGNPTLALLNKKWKWDDVLKALKDKAMPHLIRKKEEPDKDALKKLDDAELASVGCRIKQDEVFFIEPKRENPERIQA
jgi:phage host-nuclease inhibitor protein Gam